MMLFIKVWLPSAFTEDRIRKGQNGEGVWGREQGTQTGEEMMLREVKTNLMERKHEFASSVEEKLKS